MGQPSPEGAYKFRYGGLTDLSALGLMWWMDGDMGKSGI